MGFLFVEQRLPVCRYSSGWSGHRLVQRMGVGSGKHWTGKEFTGTVVVKPALTRLETCDNRVMGSGVMLRRVLVWRTNNQYDHIGRICEDATTNSPSLNTGRNQCR